VLILAPQLLDDLLRITRRRQVLAPRHATFMPDSRTQYKRNPLCLSASVARDQWKVSVSVGLTRSTETLVVGRW
jgi:hypothetical protein